MQKESQRPTTNDQRLFLYLDTSEPEAVLAIYLCKGQTLAKCQGLTLLAQEKWLAHRELSATLSDKYTGLLDKLGVSSNELSGVAVFVGPGSFTGLRIGISFANGLAYALDIPIYETKEKEKFSLDNSKKIAVPLYGADPNITKPKNK